MMTTIWVKRLAGVVGVLVVLNLIAAVVGPRLSEPLVWSRPIAQLKDEQIDEIAATDGCVQAVINGNSMGGFGIDPDQLVQQTAIESAYNAALTGSTAKIEADWFERFVEPRLHPTMLIYVVTSVTFNSKATVPALAESDWSHALESGNDIEHDIDRGATSYIPLVEYRQRLSDFDEWYRLVTGKGRLDLFRGEFADANLTTENFLSPSGHMTRTEKYVSAGPGGGIPQSTKDLFLDPWAIEPDEWTALENSLRDAQDRGLEVVLVAPPVTPDFIAVLPDGQGDYAEYQARLSELAGDLGVLLVDESPPSLPDADFVDTHHLNVDGATQLTSKVATAINESGIMPAPCTAPE